MPRAVYSRYVRFLLWTMLLHAADHATANNRSVDTALQAPAAAQPRRHHESAAPAVIMAPSAPSRDNG
jgi:hypothetical protein